MNPDDEKRIAAKLAKTMAMFCVRNTHLETIHAGRTPITKTGDYSDVFVVDADGLRIPWMEVSHINEDEMRNLMRDIVNRLYTFHLCAEPIAGVPKRSASQVCDHERMLDGWILLGVRSDPLVTQAEVCKECRESLLEANLRPPIEFPVLALPALCRPSRCWKDDFIASPDRTFVQAASFW